MRLEMASFAVRDVRFSSRTRFEAGVLHVDRDELRQVILEGGAFSDVGVDIVRPGEAVRLIHVMDAVEPRYKPEPGSSFPGFVGPQKTVGEGRTHRLAGMAVLSVGEPVAGEPTYWREALVDMAGPGAQASPFGSTANLVLDFKPRAEDLDPTHPQATMENIQLGSLLAQRYNRDVRVGQLKAAAYLAGATAGLEPDSLRVYEQAPPGVPLPKIVYFFQLNNNGVTIYGEDPAGILPSLIHPNEVLDGALINTRSNTHASYRHSTFFNQNHGVITELCTRHGVDLDFVGVIVYPAPSKDLDRKERMAEYAVKLARMLGAQGACSSYNGGGHSAVEFMLICQKCERAGIRTVQVMPESYGTPDDPGFVYFVPEAVGIVSTGRSTQPIELPALPRVLGGTKFFDLPAQPTDPLSLSYRYFLGSCSGTGYGTFAGRQY